MTNSPKVIPEENIDSCSQSQVTVQSIVPARISWKQLLLKYSSKNERIQLIIGLVCSFFTGFLIPISYIFLGDIVNENNVDNMSLERVGTILLYFVSNLLVTSIFAFYERKNLNGYAENITRRFREMYIRSVLHHDVNFIESISPGRIGQILSEESSRIINGLGPSIGQLVRAIATFMSGCIIGFLYSWELTIVTLCSAPFVVAAGFYFSKAMGQWIETLMRDHKNADTIIEESIRNIKTVSSLGVESQFIKKYTHLIEECRKMLVKALSKAGNWQFFMNFLNDLAITLVFLFATMILSNQRSDFPSQLLLNQCIPSGTDSVSVCFGDLSSLSANCQAVCATVNNCWFHSRNGQCLVGGDILIVLCGVMNSFVGVGVAFSAIPAIQKTISSASCFLDVINHKNTNVEEGKRPDTVEGDIHFKDVDFEYQSRETSVLKKLNLTIQKEEVLGIVGESGSGKSTIIKLLLRLYSPRNGRIEWNGQDIMTLSTTWIRDHISYVAQEPVLFSGTIRDNLKYGRPGCTDEEMIHVSKLVEADSFIRAFPNGYDTFVGELGNSLSGGQKQRIAIARALLRNPQILILDEATSALDSKSEEIVQRAIKQLRNTSQRRMTVVIIAHRMSSINNCDRIAVMKEGQIVEEGTHESLLKSGGVYAGLYEVQKQSIIEGEKSELTIEETTDILQTQREETKDGSTSYSFKNIYLFFGKMKPIFWLAILGDFFVGLYPPLYGIIVGYMHAIPFYDSISTIISLGFLFTGFMGILSLLHSGGNWLWWNMGNKVKEYMIVQIRRLCYSKLMGLPVAYFDCPEHSSSKITSKLSLDIRKLRDFMDEIGAFIECFFILLVGLFISFFPRVGSWQLTIICLIGAPLLFIAEYLNNKLIAGVIEKIDSNLTQSSSHLTDCILNIHTVHAYNLEQVMEDAINKELEVTNKLGSSRTLRHAISNVLSILCPTMFMIIAFGCGSILVYCNQINFLQMYVTYNTVFLFASYTGIALGKVPNMVLAKQAAQRVFSLLNTKNENDAYRSKQKEWIDGDITFDNVFFSYPSRQDQPILNGVSFTIKKGTSVAIVGSSGCGKSTIMSLIQRIYKSNAGTILLNGLDIQEFNLDSYRSRIGAVNQEPFMFSGTIRENLTMGAQHEVSTEELEDVCEQMMCMDFINEMPDRFETDLGPTGKAISGGQKQRLALVRSLLRYPKLLLLDEATSALDNENQEKVLNALKDWRKAHECTMITVAHRLSTVIDSDLIIVVNEGRIVDMGTHEELLRNCAFYFTLVGNQ